MSAASDPVRKVAAELARCAGNWEPEARLLGNVRAADIVRVCEEVLREESPEEAALRERTEALFRKVWGALEPETLAKMQEMVTNQQRLLTAQQNVLNELLNPDPPVTAENVLRGDEPE